MPSLYAISLRIPVQSPTLIGLDFPLTTLAGITRKMKQFLTCTQEKPQEQSLNNYTQQDISKMTKRSPLVMQKALNKTNNSYAYLHPN
jgi:hypothetical protein